MDIAEFEIIFRNNYRKMFLYAHDFVADTQVCYDIVSDVFLKLWEDRDKIDPDTAEAYLRTCTRNSCFLYFRQQRQFDKYKEALQLTEEEIEAIDSADELTESLIGVIDTLPDRTRYVLRQCYLHDKTYKEVADDLKITPDGVKKHIVKAYSIIRNFFKSDHGNNSDR